MRGGNSTRRGRKVATVVRTVFRRFWGSSLSVVVIFLVFLGALTVGSIWEGSSSTTMDAQRRAEDRFRQVQPPPRTKTVDYVAQRKAFRVIVGAAYRTDLSFPQLRQYYDTVLTGLGWRHLSQESRLGGTDGTTMIDTVYYCAGDLMGELVYEPVFPEWNYSFDVDWDHGPIPLTLSTRPHCS